MRGVAVWLERSGRTLAVRRSAGGLLGGLWELPGGDVLQREKPVIAVARLLREQLGLEVDRLEMAGRVTHAFTHRALTLHLFRGETESGRVRRNGFAEHRWLTRNGWQRLARSTLTKKALAVVAPDSSGPLRTARTDASHPAAPSSRSTRT